MQNFECKTQPIETTLEALDDVASTDAVVGTKSVPVKRKLENVTRTQLVATRSLHLLCKPSQS